MSEKVNTCFIKNFLQSVDATFPEPLSQSVNLADYAQKLCEKATIFVQKENGSIVSMVAGYTENLIDNMAFVSIVATLGTAKGKGYASKLIKEFIATCKDKGISAVHLYVYTGNIPAERMYQKIGFIKSDIQDRENKTHLIYYLNERGE